MILMLLTSSFSYAQSTCMSRCEDEVGIGNSACPRICKDHPDGMKRTKTKKNEVSTASGSAAATTSTSTLQSQQTQAVDKKPIPAAAASSAQSNSDKKN
jgi:hypothetical protein